ncbi:unnamed protein product, partial [Onchocerca flexuosa]|uniref:Uncharacterized protein n=1 Tax=Onchocerca flexuosa TaxID=387005 RepID=A0A183HZ95_9BILA
MTVSTYPSNGRSSLRYEQEGKTVQDMINPVYLVFSFIEKFYASMPYISLRCRNEGCERLCRLRRQGIARALCCLSDAGVVAAVMSACSSGSSNLAICFCHRFALDGSAARWDGWGLHARIQLQ